MKKLLFLCLGMSTVLFSMDQGAPESLESQSLRACSQYNSSQGIVLGEQDEILKITNPNVGIMYALRRRPTWHNEGAYGIVKSYFITRGANAVFTQAAESFYDTSSECLGEKRFMGALTSMESALLHKDPIHGIMSALSERSTWGNSAYSTIKNDLIRRGANSDLIAAAEAFCDQYQYPGGLDEEKLNRPFLCMRDLILRPKDPNTWMVYALSQRSEWGDKAYLILKDYLISRGTNPILAQAAEAYSDARGQSLSESELKRVGSDMQFAILEQTNPTLGIIYALGRPEWGPGAYKAIRNGLSQRANLVLIEEAESIVQKDGCKSLAALFYRATERGNFEVAAAANSLPWLTREERLMALALYCSVFSLSWGALILSCLVTTP